MEDVVVLCCVMLYWPLADEARRGEAEIEDKDEGRGLTLGRDFLSFRENRRWEGGRKGLIAEEANEWPSE